MRAAIYVRISEDDAEGDERGKGVARQEKDGRAEAERLGYEVAMVYRDNDVSATRSKVRPAYERMLRDIRSGHIQAVLVWDIDRLTRTPREIEDFIDLADKTGLVLVNITGSGDVGTDDGRMMLRIKGALARRETEQMRKRLKRKYLANAEEGKPHGRAPYGMMRVDWRDVPDPETAPVLREMATRVLAGESLRGIARDLTDRGIFAPNDWPRVRKLIKAGRSAEAALKEVTASRTKWNSTIIRQALVRPSYAGLRQYQGKVIGESNGEAVFDRDTHDRLVALLTDPSRKQNHRGREPLYLLSGIALCGRCGGTMRSQVGRVDSKSGKQQPSSYGCSVCFKVRRQRGPVDALVEAVVIARLTDPQVVARLFVKGDSEAAQQAMEEIEGIDAKLALNADMLDDDEMTPEQFKRSNARLRSRRDVAAGRLRAAAPNDRLEPFARGDVAATWAASPIPARREVVETLLEVFIDPQGPGKPFDDEKIRIALKTA